MSPVSPSSFPRAALASGALSAPLLSAYHAYNSLLLVGFFGLFLVLLTAVLSPGVQRNRAWVSFYIATVLYTLTYLLLFFSGEGLQFEPGPVLCLTQAAMTYAVCPLATCGAMFLSITMWMGINKPSSHRARVRVENRGIIVTWVVGIVVFLIGIGAGLSDMAGVRILHEFYCEIDNRIPARVSQVLVMFTFATNVVFQLMTFRALLLFSAQDEDARVARMSVWSVSLRMLLWNVSTISTVIVIFIFLPQDAHNERGVSLIQAALPMMALASFGTRIDILRAWRAVFTGAHYKELL